MLNCIFREKPTASRDIILLHGYKGTKNRMLSKIKEYENLTDYNVIACDARGHGSNKDKSVAIGGLCDWAKSAEDIQRLINSRKNDTVLVGNSLGGAEALYIASKNEYVKKVFAISTPFDDSFLTDSNLIAKRSIKDCVDNLDEIRNILPINHPDINKNVEYYFVHNKKDSTITAEHLNKNIEKYEVPETRVLIYEPVIASGFVSHITPYYNRKTHEFIKRFL